MQLYKSPSAISLVKMALRRPNLFKEGENGGGDGGGQGGGDGGGQGGGTATGQGGNQGGNQGGGGGNQGGGGGGGQKFFTQADVDRIVKDRVKNKDREREELISQLTALRDQGVTPENLESLNGRIEALQNEGKTKQQLADERYAKAEKEWKGKFEKADSTIKDVTGRYHTYRSKTEVLAAASNIGGDGKIKAHNPEQVYNILRPDLIMEEEMDAEGKPTGDFVPRVNFQDVDKDGKPVILKLDIPAAIKRMTEMEKHQNLFDSGGSSGLGARNNGRSGGTGTTTIPRDMGGYMEARKKNPNLLRNQGASST